ncbi:MAG TPA: hypothetical protein VLZ05_20575 [Mycobacterium sp.]|nr:hypothetical protein [Mycobacterium sp.]HUH71053.1 hypothetical protein [Mycobacterium sp.]
MSFGIAAAVVVVATVVMAMAVKRVAVTVSTPARGPQRLASARQGCTRALSWAMPLAPWVFSSVLATVGSLEASAIILAVMAVLASATARAW